MWLHTFGSLLYVGVYIVQKKKSFLVKVQFKHENLMSLFMSNWLFDILFGRKWKVEVSRWAWEWVQAVGWHAGGEAPHINTRRKRRVGAFLTASFLRHASFAFQSILPVKDCLQTWISRTERERVWLTCSPGSGPLSLTDPE